MLFSMMHTGSSLVLNLHISFSIGGIPSLTNTSEDVLVRKKMMENSIVPLSVSDGGRWGGKGKTQAFLYQLISSVYDYGVVYQSNDMKYTIGMQLTLLVW